MIYSTAHIHKGVLITTILFNLIFYVANKSRLAVTEIAFALINKYTDDRARKSCHIVLVGKAGTSI